VTDREDPVADAKGGPVSRGSMFGSQGLRTGRKFFAIWWHDRLALPPDRQLALVTASQAEPFVPMDAGRQTARSSSRRRPTDRPLSTRPAPSSRCSPVAVGSSPPQPLWLRTKHMRTDGDVGESPG
jgi:hypothetical protein